MKLLLHTGKISILEFYIALLETRAYLRKYILFWKIFFDYCRILITKVKKQVFLSEKVHTFSKLNLNYRNEYKQMKYMCLYINFYEKYLYDKKLVQVRVETILLWVHYFLLKICLFLSFFRHNPFDCFNYKL